MNRLQTKVREFNKVGGQYCADGYGLPNLTSFANQLRFLREEVDEMSDAYSSGDIMEVIDGAGDALYVLLHIFNQVGVDADVVLDEIHRSNMSKFVLGDDGKTPEAIMKDGKIQKGPHYFKPRWDQYLPQAAYNYQEHIKEQE